jgi:hypothetical protein
MKQLLTIFLFMSLFSIAFAAPPAETMEQDGIIQLMSNIEPYLKLNTDKTIEFNYEQAKTNLDAKSLEIGKRYQRFHNSTIQALVQGQKPFQSEQDQHDLVVFEPFYAAVAKSGALTTKDLLKSTLPQTIRTPKQMNLYSITKPLLSFSSKSKGQPLQFICNGGGPLAPAYCPGWNFPSTLYNSQTAANNTLYGQGYHNTYSPGCGYGNSCATDFTKWINSNGCNIGVFRTQAITYTVNTSSGIKWKYKYQTPEPNPEILSYAWPAPWWGPYVAWWHNSYC